MLSTGDTAPSFTLSDLSGSVTSLAELKAHGPVLLAFFRVSCPTCQYTFPFLERLREHNVVAISQDDVRSTREFHEAYGITLYTLIDPAKSRYPVSNAYQITRVPTLYLVESNGQIALASHGFSRSEITAAGQRFGATVFGPDEQTSLLRPG